MENGHRDEQIHRVASAHLAWLKEINAEEWKDTEIDVVGSGNFSIWWHDHIELFEVSLCAPNGSSGYLIVNLDPRLPPVIQYTHLGARFSQNIIERLEFDLLPVGVDIINRRVVFISFYEIFVEFLSENGEKCWFDIGRNQLYSKDAIEFLNTDPTNLFDKSRVSSLWANLTLRPTVSRAVAHVVDRATPVLYNQECEVGREGCKIEINSPNTPCAPKSISGCTPVAWAMLASSYKKLNLSQSSAIWPGSSNWQIDWPSSSYYSSQSAAVRRTIWDAHGEMQTSVNGETSHSNMVYGQNIFRHMGLNWEFKSDRSTVDDICNMVQIDRPVIWSAFGPWPNYGHRAQAGHSVVIFGYNKIDGTFRVALGWGSSHKPVNVPYGQFDYFHCEYPNEAV